MTSATIGLPPKSRLFSLRQSGSGRDPNRVAVEAMTAVTVR